MDDIFNLFKLNNKLCLVTGGAGLLGKKHAESYLEAGAQVVLVDVNQGALENAGSELQRRFGNRVQSLKCDITSEDDVERLRDNVYKIHQRHPEILVNNAAIDSKFSHNTTEKPLSRLENFPLENWHRELNVGLAGSFLCAKIFGREMADVKKGTIINVASDLGLISPNQNLYKIPGVAEEKQPVKPVTYSVVKHGLIGLTKYLATYWAKSGVRCNAIAPGGVFNGHSEEFVNRISELIPMGRMANLDEYKAAMIFLASDASSYMTGAVLTMDGGRSVW